MYISVMFNPISLRDLMYAPCICFLCISLSSFSSFFFFAIYFKGSSIFKDFNVSFIICNFVIKHMLFRSEKFWELFHSVFMDPIVLADNLSFLIYFRTFPFFIVTEFRTTLPSFDFIHQFFFAIFKCSLKNTKSSSCFLFYLAFITCLLRHQRKHYTFRRTTLSYGYHCSASKPCLLFSRTGT